MDSEIARQFDKLQDHFQSDLTRPLAFRREQLGKLKKLITRNHKAIAEALKQDLGKCNQESWMTETGYLIGDIEHHLKHLKKWTKPRRVSTPVIAQPGHSFIQPEPLGTVLVMGAWNYPLQLSLAPLISAIAAGNCAVLKPSELAPNTSTLLAELIPQYLDERAVQVVEGGVEVSTELLKQPWDHVFYTGGERVGKIVMTAAAKHLSPVTLELGGKSPCIVADDCELKVTADRIVWSKWMNAGQTCVAPDYILVERRFAETLTGALTKSLQRFYGKDARQSADYGCIINDNHFYRLVELLKGQNIVHGGQTDADSRYIEPTLVLDPDPSSTLMTEEIFGPILPIITMDSLDDSLTFINRRPKPLALYLYTKNRAFEQQLLNKTSAGSVCINDGMMFMANMKLPFGGVGNSGIGRYHGQWGFDTFSHLKSVMRRGTWFDINWRYPPFNKFKLLMLKLFQ
ncbi:Aldehyde dehydrogenase (NAD(+)) [Saliniradius amylolyticus]|uniref:Aldehyde dehydrogenase n=1 Tax=Saliniradius amylolyticus TaxID=2183582 RepID=A0A2S2E6W9_9ALTE|nr:aldehyde dehydrogenase family protein [Saliniradius amylolyticus]AWL13282.1 Aldehyde dehydrogenase (NAD(+)) [Saliniradius amylolyticus]